MRAQHVKQQRKSLLARQVFEPQNTAMWPLLPPDHFLEILIGRHDDALLAARPGKNIVVSHTRIDA